MWEKLKAERQSTFGVACCELLAAEKGFPVYLTVTPTALSPAMTRSAISSNSPCHHLLSSFSFFFELFGFVSFRDGTKRSIPDDNRLTGSLSSELYKLTGLECLSLGTTTDVQGCCFCRFHGSVQPSSPKQASPSLVPWHRVQFLLRDSSR